MKGRVVAWTIAQWMMQGRRAETRGKRMGRWRCKASAKVEVVYCSHVWGAIVKS